ncbi:MAG: nucleotidyl transferase AbiEii/AbiGii toxin family protein [Burkholderiaceae bacterium]|nr:nucleotidyl transferase AbiEii/AbiGii toxin family protein [Burkholderiaceae bacterium]
MAAIYSPSEKGFDERLTAIDRCQVALLREIVGQYGSRLVLKDGMAMRAVFGSMRLTKDIDFDRDASLSLDSAKNGLPKTLVRAASVAGIRQPDAQVTKLTATTIRARLSGQTNAGIPVRFEVEISGRGDASPQERRKETVIAPPSYGMAPFLVESYSTDALAAMKVAAAMSEARNVPRDIYDLYDLVKAGARPARLLASAPVAVLERIQAGATDKLDGIGFDLAREELLPYLPASLRDTLTEDRWLDYTLAVGEALERWAAEALMLKGMPP